MQRLHCLGAALLYGLATHNYTTTRSRERWRAGLSWRACVCSEEKNYPRNHTKRHEENHTKKVIRRKRHERQLEFICFRVASCDFVDKAFSIYSLEVSHGG